MNKIETIHDEVKNSVSDWLHDHDYSAQIYISNNGIIYSCDKISHDDRENFKEEFDCDLVIKSISYKDISRTEVNEITYEFYHPKLHEIYNDAANFLNRNNITYSYLFLTNQIEITCYEELSQEDIAKFEEYTNSQLVKFNFKCSGGMAYYFR